MKANVTIKAQSSKITDSLPQVARMMCEKLKKEQEHTTTKIILNLVGTGLLSLTQWYPSQLTRFGSPYLADPEAYTFSKRFNIPYLKRTIKRLEKQKFVKVEEKDGIQIVSITNEGKTKILKGAISTMSIKKPHRWNGTWWLVSYDLPNHLSAYRHIIRNYFITWGFYPLHKSVYLHAYPCSAEVEMVREYFGLGEYIRIFKIAEIEQNKPFKDFFDIQIRLL